MNVGIVTPLKDKRLQCQQFLSPRDVFPQPFSQRRIDLGSDLHWLWGTLVILTLPAVLEETQNFFQCLNWWQIVAFGSEMRCDIWQMIQAFLFFFLPVFLSYSISCFLFCMQQFLSLSCELVCVCGLLWRGLWKVIRERKVAGRSKSAVVCLYLEWEMVRHPQIIKKEWIPLLQRVRQHSSPWYLNYLFLVVKPGVTCLRLFSELEPKHVCVPSKKGMHQRGCSFIAELGTLKPLQGLSVGHISSPHTALDLFVVIVWLPCVFPKHWQFKEPLKMQVRKGKSWSNNEFLFLSVLNQNICFLLLLLGFHWNPFSNTLLNRVSFHLS